MSKTIGIDLGTTNSVVSINPTFAIRTEKRSFLGINSLETLDFTGVDFQNGL